MLPELLAPAGNMEKAIAAIEAGADALYLGFKHLSARKAADNFSLEEYQLILGYAHSRNVKVYTALNTLLAETELHTAAEYVKYIELLGGDAVIIQDLGLLHYIRQNHPDLTIHASTQMAIHNNHGVAFAQDAGIKRVVLSRECTLQEISSLQKDFPEMEFEVFIHGAQCYGFSGLCHASGRILNRSGNKGACGQICRTFMSDKNNKGYYFSAMDMMQDSIPELLHSVHSFKIEGRMKSPDYVFNTISYYRDLIDTGRSSAEKKEAMQISFSRSQNSGYLFSADPKKQVDRDFAGHSGVEAGKIVSIKTRGRSTFFTITLAHDISLRDGLLLLQTDSASQDRSPANAGYGSVKNIFKNGKTVNLAQKGDRVQLESQLDSQKLYSEKKASLYINSRHDKHIKTKGIPARLVKRIPLQLQVDIGENLQIHVSAPEVLKMEIQLANEDTTQAVSPERFESQLKKSSDPMFYVEDIVISPDSKLPSGTAVKQIKNALYDAVNTRLRNYLQASPEKLIIDSACLKVFTPEYHSIDSPDNPELPFAFAPYTESDILLPPVCFNSRQTEIDLAEAPENACIRLTNPGQLMYAKNADLAKLRFYGDYGIYINNSWAKAFIAHNFPEVSAVCEYNEKQEQLPLFIHRGDAHVPAKLSQKSNNSTLLFKTLIKDGISYTFVSR